MTDQAADIVFDITDVDRFMSSGRAPTGIQRAALMITHHAAEAMAAEGRTLWIGRYKRKPGVYQVRPATDLAEVAGLGPDVAEEQPNAPSMLSRYANDPRKLRFHTFKADLHALRGNADWFARKGTSLAEWRAFRSGGGRAGDIVPRWTDDGWTTLDGFDAGPEGGALRVFVPGSAFDDRFIEANLKAMSAAGAQVSALVHDVIALIHPEWFEPPIATIQTRWMRDSLAYCDLYVANSVSTAADVTAVLAELGRPDKRVATVPLAQAPVRAPAVAAEGEGDAIDRRIARADRLDAATKAATRSPYVLCVGTLETRKNAWRLVQAWLALSQADPDTPRLVLVGAEGWLNGDLLEALEATGGFGGRVLYLGKRSDHDLDHLYRNCVFTAYVSLYEGWGLPIGESLAYGKTCLTSEASSMPEVGGDLVEYCDPASIVSIRDAAARLLEEGRRAELEARIAAADLRTWEDVARDVLAALDGG